MSGLDSKEYQLALARTRQAMHVHKAVGFMNTSNSARQAPNNHAQPSHTLSEAMQTCSDGACSCLKGLSGLQGCCGAAESHAGELHRTVPSPGRTT